jgi:hypothetical protein
MCGPGYSNSPDWRVKVGAVSRFLDQAPALVGVVLGALATIVATSVNDKSRWKRAQSVRWDERRLEAYTEYARAIKDVYTAAARLATERIPVLSAAPVGRESGLELLAEATAQRTKAWETVLLLGDAPTVRAARDWREAIWQLERIATDSALGSSEWEQSIGAVDRARDSFYAAARGSLAVVGGSVAQASWLSSKAPWLSSTRRQAGSPAESANDTNGTGRSARQK